MRQHLSFSVKLNYLLIAFYALDATNLRFVTIDSNVIGSSHFCEPDIYIITQSSNFMIFHTISIVYIVQRLMYSLSKQQLQVVSLILLLEGSKSYSVYHCYLQKYRLLFRKFFTINTIGSYHYYSNKYINKIALISLRIILLCSQIHGTYIFWLYLACYKHNPET